MANMMSMLKDAASMQRKMKRMQKDLARRTAEHSDKGITVVARGDMTVKNIKIDPATADLARPDRLSQSLLTVVNAALKKVKKEAEGEMAKMADGLGLSEMLAGGKQ